MASGECFPILQFLAVIEQTSCSDDDILSTRYRVLFHRSKDDSCMNLTIQLHVINGKCKMA